jgi:hypothetical protein
VPAASQPTVPGSPGRPRPVGPLIMVVASVIP